MSWPFRRRRAVLFVMCLVMGFGWMLTATWGVRDVTAYAERAARCLEAPDREIQYLDFDPDVWPNPREKKMPWSFVGNASAPFPFIVAIDAAHQVAPTAGQRSRYYVLWFFGLKLPVHQSMVWMS